MFTLPQIFPYAVCLLILVAATATDIKTRKIPNRITFPAILSGIVYGILAASDMRLEKILFLGVCLIFAFIAGFGMGDVKLIMGVGLWSSPLEAFAATALASFSVFFLSLLKNPKGILRKSSFGFLHLFSVHDAEIRTERNSYPFAPFLLLAFVIIEGGRISWLSFT